MSSVPFKYPSIPQPYKDLGSMYETVIALKEAIEQMTGQSGVASEIALTSRKVLELESDFNSGNTNTNAKITEIYETLADADKALAQKTLDLQASYNAVDARVTQVQLAYAAADSVLARDITNVSAQYNNISASGSVMLQSSGNIFGMTSTYSVYLTAGAKYAGMTIGVDSSGGANMLFQTSKFQFVDAGTAKTVFTYGGGKFRFTGDVTMDGNLLVNGTVTGDKFIDRTIPTPKLEDRSVTEGSSAQGSTLNNTLSVPLTLRGGNSMVLIICTIFPRSNTYTGGTGALTGMSHNVVVDSTVIDAFSPSTFSSTTTDGLGNPVTTQGFFTTTNHYTVKNLSAGLHFFRMTTTVSGWSGRVTVVEFSK
jgi:hypothetical protein